MRKPRITTADVLEHLRCVCQRCGYEWVRRPHAEPRVCLRCKSLLWRVPKPKAEGAA